MKLDQEKLMDLFAQASALPREKRREFLDGACGAERTLRAEVESLLAAHDGAGDFLGVVTISEPPVPTAPPSADSSPSTSNKPAECSHTFPTRIGQYTILDLLGAGGMGVVYRAEQPSVRRIVALKVIGASFVSQQLLKRFEYETRVLGRLKHPGIAQIYDAGTADTGRGPQPFFAMELVEGVPLDKYVAHNKLSVQQRLELLIKLCDAVHYAHQQGIIHRDLKPANILVTEERQPKILDFGVARAIESDVQATTMQTDIGQLVGTLPYMSPEQAGGNPDEIDTRSDVYALGVIAFELLGGRLPYQVHGVAMPEAIRVIREDEPSRLSSIDRRYRGDIETIVGKALEKDKTRRYQAASALAADVKRYLDYEPITARPPSAWYQLSKFARRNKAVVGGALATFLVLLGGVIVSVSLYLRAEHQRKQAADDRENLKATLAFLTNDVLAGATPENIPDPRVREQIVSAMVTPAAQRVTVAFKDRPLIEASVRDAIGTVLWKIGRGDLALPQAEAVVTLHAGALGENHPHTIAALNNYAVVLKSMGRSAEAEPLFKRALDLRRRELGADHPDTILSQHNYADVLVSLGRAVEAEQLATEALQRRSRVLGEDQPQTILSLGLYASVLEALGRSGEAEPYYKQAMERSRRALGEDHPDAITALSEYASVLQSMGRSAEAVSLHEQAFERSCRVLSEAHPSTIRSLNLYAMALYSLDRKDQAAQLFKRALNLRRRVLGDDHPDTIGSLGDYASVLYSIGRAAEAEPLLQQAFERSRRVLGEDHPSTIRSLNNWAFVLQSLGRMQAAEPLLKQALELSRRRLGDDHPDTLSSLNNNAGVLELLGRFAEAEPLFRQAMESRRRVLGEDHPDAIASLHNYAEVLQHLDRGVEAERFAREAVAKATANTSLGPRHEWTKRFAVTHARSLDALGRHAEAAAVRQEFGQPDPTTQPMPRPSPTTSTTGAARS